MRRLLGYTAAVLSSLMTISYAWEYLKQRIDQFAQTETVSNAPKYVMVKLARGDYNNINGPETLVYDYKFFKTIQNFHKN